MTIKTIIRHLALALLLTTGSAFALDNKGTEFVFAFQNNYQNSGTLNLYITADQDTSGQVEVPGYEATPGVSFVAPFDVLANQVTTVELPTAISVLTRNGSSPLGIYLTAQEEVSVYGLNLQSYTTDAFMAIPVDVLGREYLVKSYDGLAQFAGSGLSSQFAVIATADNTNLAITPSVDVNGQLAGQTFIVQLDRLEVYQLNTNDLDLTGTSIVASDPVALMGGHRCADVPSVDRSPSGGRIGWCDHLIEMLPPVNTWGYTFSVVPLASRLNGSVIRVLASENGTDVRIGQNLAAVRLNRGEFHETVLTDYAEITATAPVLVTQYAPGQAFDGVAADPFMMHIAPNEQFLDAYTIATPVDSFGEDFVNVVLPTTAAASLRLNGEAPAGNLFTEFGNSGLSGTQISLDDGAYTVTADQPFGIYVYGFNSYESYGYPGGMALAEINPLGDSYAPNIGGLRQVGRTLLGVANDSEDLNANGIIDPGEDINANGVLDRRTEDSNGNGILDPGEDVNANGILDRDRGVLKVELLPGAANLSLAVTEFVAGLSPKLFFRVDLVDPANDGSGRLRVEDLNGNAAEVDVNVSSTAILADVHLTSTVSGDRIVVDQSTFSHPPAAVAVAAGQTVIDWHFDAIAADQVELIGFDVELLDPLPGEQRLVTQNLNLSYVNAVGGEPVTIALGPQYVNVAATAFSLSANTGQANYGANVDAAFQAVVTNNGTALNSATLEFTIEDSNGIVVASLTAATAGDLAPGTSLVVDRSWNTGAILAGSYQLRVALVDTGNAIVNQALVPFAVVYSTEGLPVTSLNVITGEDTGGVFIEKTEYHTSDLVQIQGRINNISANTIVGNSRLEIVVLDPNGSTIFELQQLLGNDLLPGAVVDELATLVLDNAIQGEYRVQAILVDATTSALLASSNSVFTVLQQYSLAVDGEVEALYTDLLVGEVQTCTYSVTSRVDNELTGLSLRQSLINLSTQQAIQSRDRLLNLQPGASDVQTVEEISAVIAGGDYACVLEVSTSEGYRNLGYAAFTVFSDVSQSLIGNVTARFPELLRGDIQQCSYELASRVSTPLTGLEVRQSLLDTDNQVELSSRELLFDVEPGVATVDPRDEDTGAAADEGNLACAFEITTTAGLTDLGQAAFVIYNLIADPGTDRTAFVGEQVSLDASASREADGLTLSYSWQFIEIPAGSTAVLSDSSAVDPTFFVDEQGSYIVELVVDNGSQQSLPRRVVITVPNRLPVADAGQDDVVAVGEQVVLDAAGSFDLDGDPLTFRWSILQQPEGSLSALSDSAAVNPSLVIDVSGVYIIALVVNDGFEDSVADTVLFNVGNVPPVANAGSDIAALVGDIITLDGSGSSDANGDQLDFAWFFDGVPPGSNATLFDTATPRPYFSIDIEGDYVVNLIVNDGLANSVIDTVRISVGNVLPVANAGPDQSGFLGNRIQLDGSSSSDPNGDPLSYRWNLISKPANSFAVLSDVFAAMPFFDLDVQGDYVVQLIVNDGIGDSPPDTVFITADNLRPIAIAGFDGVGDIYTGAVIGLDGLDSFDPDGGAITYRWSFVDRPAGSAALFDDENSPTPSFTIDVAGDYIVQLVVNDGELDSEPETVFVEGVQACIDNFAIRPKFNKITLTWDFNPEVPEVEVERATNKAGPYEVIANSDSTYATYLDSGLDFGPVYYYRIRGILPVEQAEVIQCRDVGEGVICEGMFCSFRFGEVLTEVVCGEQVCPVDSFGEDGAVFIICDGDNEGPPPNRCPDEDLFCGEICEALAGDPEDGELLIDIEEEYDGEFDFAWCLPPVSEQRFCATQILASTPIGRVRTARVPDLIGMSLAQAEQEILANRLVLGNVSFERTTAVPDGQVIRQDMPRNSVMPYQTAIDLVLSTRGTDQ